MSSLFLKTITTYRGFHLSALSRSRPPVFWHASGHPGPHETFLPVLLWRGTAKTSREFEASRSEAGPLPNTVPDSSRKRGHDRNPKTGLICGASAPVRGHMKTGCSPWQSEVSASASFRTFHTPSAIIPRPETPLSVPRRYPLLVDGFLVLLTMIGTKNCNRDRASLQIRILTIVGGISYPRSWV